MKIRTGYDPAKPPRERTRAQMEQFRLARVRGLWFHAYSLTGERRALMQAVIDAELIAHGQEGQTQRRERQQAELEAELRKEHP